MLHVKQLAKSVQKFTIDNSPSILTAVAVAGVVSSAVLAVKATPQALRNISEAESEHTMPLTYMDKVKLTWTCYIPALSVGVLTIAAVVGANDINMRRNAALVSVFTVTESAFKEYRTKVGETIGENKERKLRDELAQERIDRNPMTGGTVIISGNGEVDCYDSLSGRYFKSDMESIRKAENDINHQVMHDGYATLNDFYHEIGIPDTEMGKIVGWNSDTLFRLDYSACLSEDNKPCISVDYAVKPTADYYRFH